MPANVRDTRENFGADSSADLIAQPQLQHRVTELRERRGVLQPYDRDGWHRIGDLKPAPHPVLQPSDLYRTQIRNICR